MFNIANYMLMEIKMINSVLLNIDYRSPTQSSPRHSNLIRIACTRFFGGWTVLAAHLGLAIPDLGRSGYGSINLFTRHSNLIRIIRVLTTRSFASPYRIRQWELMSIANLNGLPRKCREYLQGNPLPGNFLVAAPIPG
jgi:hypothetical protein